MPHPIQRGFLFRLSFARDRTRVLYFQRDLGKAFAHVRFHVTVFVAYDPCDFSYPHPLCEMFSPRIPDRTTCRIDHHAFFQDYPFEKTLNPPGTNKNAAPLTKRLFYAVNFLTKFGHRPGVRPFHHETTDQKRQTLRNRKRRPDKRAGTRFHKKKQKRKIKPDQSQE